MTMDKALHLRDNIDYMRQEKKEAEELPAVMISWMRQYDDSKSTVKRAKKDYLLRPETS